MLKWGSCTVLVFEKLETISARYRRIPIRKEIKAARVKTFDGEFEKIRGLIIKKPEVVMPVKFYGLFGQSHGLELELKKQIKRSIKEEVFFDYKERCYEIQSFSLKGSRHYINVRQIPNPGLYPSNKRVEILSSAI